MANGTRPGHLACDSAAATIRCAPFTICLHSPQRLALSPPPPGLSSGLDVRCARSTGRTGSRREGGKIWTPIDQRQTTQIEFRRSHEHWRDIKRPEVETSKDTDSSSDHRGRLAANARSTHTLHATGSPRVGEDVSLPKCDIDWSPPSPPSPPKTRELLER